MSNDASAHDAVMSDQEVSSSLESHAAKAATCVRRRLGGGLDEGNLQRYLSDSECLRYPTTIIFDADALEPQQFAGVEMVGEGELRVCILHMRPCYDGCTGDLPYLVAYMAAAVDYGIAASPDLSLRHAATLMGLPEDDYYERLCAIVDANQPG